MLKKKFRLLKDTKFKKNFSVNAPFFVLKFAKNEQAFSTFGFVVSKKLDKRAVVRNRIKRQMRVTIENNFDKIKAGFDILLIAKNQIVGKNTKEISDKILEEFKNQELLK